LGRVWTVRSQVRTVWDLVKTARGPGYNPGRVGTVRGRVRTVKGQVRTV